MSDAWKTDPVILRELYAIEGLLHRGKTQVEIADALSLSLDDVSIARRRLSELVLDELNIEREVHRGFVLSELTKLKEFAYVLEDYEGVRRILKDVRDLLGLDAPKEVNVDLTTEQPIAWVSTPLEE